MTLLKSYFINFFKGHERTVKAKKHIIYSLFLKGVSIVVGLAFVPLILNYLDAERYGIWLTLSSIIAWFSFFDIGLGNGLRNRFAEAKAKGNEELARTYISTTYAILGIVFIGVIIIFLLINPFLNWQKILNTTAVDTKELKIIALIVFVFFILRFFFKLIGTILMADQRPAINNAFGTISNLLALIIIFILTKTTKGSLINLAAVLSITPVFVLAVATVLFFFKDYRKYIPSIKYVDFSKSKDLLGLGVKFFYFQIANIIIYSTTNFFIAHFSDQQMVAAYNISYKYLSLTYMIFLIVLSPIWSAVTDAFVKNDKIWLKETLKKLVYLSIFFIIILLVLVAISKIVYENWIGNSIIIPNSINYLVAIYLMFLIFNGTFSAFINGFGKLKIGLYTISFNLILFIPIVYVLGKNHGVSGVLSAMILIQVPSGILQILQVIKIINGTAKGIWNE